MSVTSRRRFAKSGPNCKISGGNRYVAPRAVIQTGELPAESQTNYRGPPAPRGPGSCSGSPRGGRRGPAPAGVGAHHHDSHDQ